MLDNELSEAFSLLFDKKTDLYSISIEKAKYFYRKKSLRLHPDLYYSAPESIKKEKTLKFIKLNEAYNCIVNFLQTQSCNQKLPYKPTLIKMPNRFLRFAEFLYYKNKISWSILIQALSWQKRNRRKIGEIAIKWHYLNDFELEYILYLCKELKKPIGKIMLNLSIINEFQLKVLLYQQSKEQPKIGQYFVLNSLFKQDELIYYLKMQKIHNSKFKYNLSNNLF
ncbi:MAG: hypothetical protein QXX11_04885 [Thermoplasmata archaeon]